MVTPDSEAELLGFDWVNNASMARWLSPIVRLHPGVSRQQAQERMGSLLPAVKSMDGSSTGFLLLTPSQANLARTFRIRGRLVSCSPPMQTYSSGGSVLLWIMGLSCLMALLLREGLSFTEICLLWLASIFTRSGQRSSQTRPSLLLLYTFRCTICRSRLPPWLANISHCSFATPCRNWRY